MAPQFFDQCFRLIQYSVDPTKSTNRLFIAEWLYNAIDNETLSWRSMSDTTVIFAIASTNPHLSQAAEKEIFRRGLTGARAGAALLDRQSDPHHRRMDHALLLNGSPAFRRFVLPLIAIYHSPMFGDFLSRLGMLPRSAAKQVTLDIILDTCRRFDPNDTKSLLVALLRRIATDRKFRFDPQANFELIDQVAVTDLHEAQFLRRQLIFGEHKEELTKRFILLAVCYAGATVSDIAEALDRSQDDVEEKLKDAWNAIWNLWHRQ